MNHMMIYHSSLNRDRTQGYNLSLGLFSFPVHTLVTDTYNRRRNMKIQDLYNIRVKDDYKDAPSDILLQRRLPWLTALDLRNKLERDSRDCGDMHVRYRLEKA